MEITVGICEYWPYRGVTEGLGAGRKCTATKLNYQASAMGCKVKQVYLLPDVPVRFKGLFVAVPQIAMNRSMPSGQSRMPSRQFRKTDQDDRAAPARDWQ
jgi:hypothetical protein